MNESPLDEPETAVEYVLEGAEIDPKDITEKDILKAYQLGWRDGQDLNDNEETK